MNKIIMILAGLVVAFLIGFAGLYFVMPLIAPDKVEEAQRTLDSLEIANGLPLGRNPLMMYDSLNTLRGHLDSLLTLGDVVAASMQSQDERIVTLRDSLKEAHTRLGVMEREHTELLGLLDELSQRMKVLESQRVDVKNMSKTLAKLEDKELRAIVSQMNSDVLAQLYLEGSDRERKSFLAALPSDRAARFVARMVRTPNTPTPAALPANDDALEDALDDAQNDPPTTSPDSSATPATTQPADASPADSATL